MYTGIHPPYNEYRVFYSMIEDVKKFAESYNGSAFFICNQLVGCLLQDSVHFYLSPPYLHAGKVYKAGKFMNNDLFLDSTMEDDDYRLILKFGKGDSREIVIDNLLNDRNDESLCKILDLSHYKGIIK